MKKLKHKWQMVGRPEPKGEGQRFFIRDDGVWDASNPAHRADRDRAIRSGGVKLYVADNSGGNPECTDDGPLKLLRDEPLTVGMWCGRIGVDALVHVERNVDDPSNRCGFTFKEALWLVEKAGFTVKLSDKVAAEWAIITKLYDAQSVETLAPCMSYCKRTTRHDGECEPMEGR